MAGFSIRRPPKGGALYYWPEGVLKHSLRSAGLGALVLREWAAADRFFPGSPAIRGKAELTGEATVGLAPRSAVCTATEQNVTPSTEFRGLADEHQRKS